MAFEGTNEASQQTADDVSQGMDNAKDAAVKSTSTAGDVAKNTYNAHQNRKAKSTGQANSSEGNGRDSENHRNNTQKNGQTNQKNSSQKNGQAGNPSSSRTNSNKSGYPHNTNAGANKQNLNKVGSAAGSEKKGAASAKGTATKVKGAIGKGASAGKKAASAVSKTLKWIARFFGWIFSLVGICIFVVLVLCIGIMAYFSRPSGSSVEGLPPSITVEMVEAFLEMQEKYGHPTSTGIAQLIIESGSDSLSGLAYDCKNLFGIKYSAEDDSYAINGKVWYTREETPDGVSYYSNESFAEYASYADCIYHRAEMLEWPRYASYTSPYKIKKGEPYTEEDANNFMIGIKSGGWATSSYSDLCITLMQQYDLYRFDTMTLEEFEKSIKSTGNIVVIGDGDYTNPCPGGIITSTFGYREYDHSYHKGLDLGASTGTPTYAAAEGDVIIAGWSDSAGNWVVIDHGNGMVTKYMHHSGLCVSAGQHVKKGEQIGYVGNTGWSDGAHLHFQMEFNGEAVDPLGYISP